MEKNVTAIEWLQKQLERLYYLDTDPYESVFEKAKEMEKEQIKKAIEFGYSNDDDFTGIDYFYEITFNGGKNICPNCKQGILRMERPGKIGCSVC
jgi:hypothetical protein